MSEHNLATEPGVANITHEEWELIRTHILNVRDRRETKPMYNRAKMAESMKLLEDRNNTPTTRQYLFIDLFTKRGENPIAVSADTSINALLKHRKLPFALRRYGGLTGQQSTYEAKIRMERI
ncbi:MAG: hypothetical protein Q7R54_02250 [bacterium]|nr:hypothetical protein [bacterium]